MVELHFIVLETYPQFRTSMFQNIDPYFPIEFEKNDAEGKTFGMYHAFEIDILDANDRLYECLIIYNQGDAELKTGLWGAAYDRTTK